MTELVITRGLPASGKSRWAMAWGSIGDRVVIERDMIRLDIMGMQTTKGTQQQEDLVTKLQRSMVEQALCSGWSVCVADTNLPQSRAREWAALAAQCHAEFRVADHSHVPLEDCLRWNATRTGTVKFVPESVIIDMHQRFIASGNFQAQVEPVVIEPVRQYKSDWTKRLPEAFIFDIDGTLALMGERSPFEWHKVGLDRPNHWVMDIAEAVVEAGYKVIVMSGRDGVCRPETEAWLKLWSVPYDVLLMRHSNDNRKDSIIKAELFWDNVAPHYSVSGVFDDRNQVVEMWRAMGVNCAQVALGDF